MSAKKRKYKKKKSKSKKQTGFAQSFTKRIILILLLIIAVSIALLYLEDHYGIFQAHRPSSGRQQERYDITGLHIPRYVSSNENQQIINHKGFTVNYSQKHRQPNWVGYELTVDETKGRHNRTDKFIGDPYIKGASAHTSDYSKSGYDRGHMAPAADMKWHKQAMDESFYLSNICPQHPDLNRQTWKVLEDRARDWAVSDSVIVIVCGPIINDKCRRIGKNKVSIPDGFFKVILSPYASPPQAIGFLFKNKKSPGALRKYAVTIDSVEVVTGLDFFHQLPDSIESTIEASINIAYWGLYK